MSVECEILCDFVVARREITRPVIFRTFDNAGLKRAVKLPERHRGRNRAEGGNEPHHEFAFLDSDFHSLEIGDGLDFPLRIVEVPGAGIVPAESDEIRRFEALEEVFADLPVQNLPHMRFVTIEIWHCMASNIGAKAASGEMLTRVKSIAPN